MKIEDILSQAALFLQKTSPSARLDAEVILADTLICRREDLYIHSKKELAPEQLAACLKKIERRIQGEPVAYITNKKDFLNYTFHVEPGVLIPRPETELLVEYALDWIEKKDPRESLWILDLGAGSGCIGLSLLKEVSNLRVVAVDVSTHAKKVCFQNAKNLKVEDRFFFYLESADNMDFRSFEALKKEGFSGSFDVVISNPPYIEDKDTLVEPNVRKFEPHEALFCEEGGLQKIRLWTSLAGSLLKPGAPWIFEIGSSQGKAALEIVRSSGFFKEPELAQDYSGRDRFIISFKHEVSQWTKLQSKDRSN